MASALPRSVAGAAPPPAEVDQNALLLMLSYVEAECRRLGAAQAAEHAAAAASCLPHVAPELYWPVRADLPRG